MHVSQEARQEGLRYYTKCYDRRRVYMDVMRPNPNADEDSDDGNDDMEPVLVKRMVVDNEGVQNLYYINFNLDFFDHGQSKCLSPLFEPPGPDDFNFEGDVLEKVQRIYQRPCYKSAERGFTFIAATTINTTAIFRHPLWKNLREVTMMTDVFQAGTYQEGLAWTFWRLSHENRVRTWLNSKDIAKPRNGAITAASALQGLRPTEDSGPLHFEVHFKWRWIRSYLNQVAKIPGPIGVQDRSISPARRQQNIDTDRETLERCAEIYRLRGD